ncbi:MAG: S41 family peptidase [Bacteroidota bacterium]
MKFKLILLVSCLWANTLWAQAEFPNTLSKADKVYGLSKIWQEVNYNFVYINEIDREKWNTYYKQLITEVQHTPNDYDYYRLLAKFCAMLNDGHTNIYYPKSIQNALYTTSFGEYSFYVETIEDKAIISKINESKKEEIPIGTEVLEVNGIPVHDYANDHVMPYISSSTDYVREEMAIFQLLKAPLGTRFTLLLKKPDGEMLELDVTHAEAKDDKMYPEWKNLDPFEFKWVNDETAYIALNSFMDAKLNEQFIKTLPELRKAKQLIIDLRKNGGGRNNVAMEVLEYLTDDDELPHAAYQSRLHIPYYKSSGRYLTAEDTMVSDPKVKEWRVRSFLSYHDNYWYSLPYSPMQVDLAKSERLVMPTVILVGHGTASTSEDFLIAAESQDHIIRMGQESFGSTGQAIHFDLPGGGSFRVCSKKDTYPDGRIFVGVGIQPDIRVEPTLEDFMKGRDTILEAAIEYFNQ